METYFDCANWGWKTHTVGVAIPLGIMSCIKWRKGAAARIPYPRTRCNNSLELALLWIPCPAVLQPGNNVSNKPPPLICFGWGICQSIRKRNQDRNPGNLSALLLCWDLEASHMLRYTLCQAALIIVLSFPPLLPLLLFYYWEEYYIGGSVIGNKMGCFIRIYG